MCDKKIQEYFSKHAFLLCPDEKKSCIDENEIKCVDEDEKKLNDIQYPITFNPTNLSSTLNKGETKEFKIKVNITGTTPYKFIQSKMHPQIIIHVDNQPSYPATGEFEVILEISSWGFVLHTIINYYAVDSNDKPLSDIFILKLN